MIFWQIIMPLRLETLIRDKISEEIPEIKGVHGMPKAGNNPYYPVPCVYVLFNNSEAFDHRGNNKQSMLRVIWSVIVSVSSISDTLDGKNARSSAQSIVSKVIETLSGWRPITNGTPLKYENSLAPFYGDGIYLFQVNFSITYPIGG